MTIDVRASSRNLLKYKRTNLHALSASLVEVVENIAAR